MLSIIHWNNVDCTILVCTAEHWTVLYCYLYSTVQHCTILYCALHCTALFCNLLRWTVVWSATLHWTVLTFTILHCIVNYCIPLFLNLMYCIELKFNTLHCTVIYFNTLSPVSRDTSSQVAWPLSSRLQVPGLYSTVQYCWIKEFKLNQQTLLKKMVDSTLVY